MFYWDLYGNERFERKKQTEMYPISLKGPQICCEDHPGKTTEGNVKGWWEEGGGVCVYVGGFKEKIAD